MKSALTGERHPCVSISESFMARDKRRFMLGGMMRFIVLAWVLALSLSFVPTSVEAKGFIRMIERMFPSKRANVEDTTRKDQKENPTTQEGFFDKFGKDSFLAAPLNKNKDRAVASDAVDSESESSGVIDGAEGESEDEEGPDLLEEALDTKDPQHQRRSALVMALISEKNVMKLGLKTFNQSCGQCHGSFLNRSSLRKRNKKTFKVLPKVDLQKIEYRYANSEEVIKNHLMNGFEENPSHRFPALTPAQLHAVTRFVMSLN